MRPSFRLGGSASAAPSPRLSRRASELTDVICELSPVQPYQQPPAHDSPPVEDRLLQYGRLYDEKLNQARVIRQQQEEAAMLEVIRPPSPLQPRRLFAPTPSLHANAEIARRHRADRLRAYISEREAQQTRQPAILPTSRDMAAAMRQREKWEGLSVGEILQVRQKTHEARMEAKRREEVAKLPFKPAVSEQTKRLKTSRPVVERLYKNSNSNPARDDTAEGKRKNGTVLADITNRYNSARANVNSTAASAATYQRLYHDAVVRRTQSKTHEKLPMHADTDFRPTIDPVSQLIASQREDTVQARLLNSKSASDPTKHVSPEETFAPRINNRSNIMMGAAARLPSSISLPVRNDMWLQRRRDRLRHVEAERQDAEMRECTFHPRTNRGPASGSPWGMTDEGDSVVTTPLSSSVDLIKSTEKLLRHIDLDEPTFYEDDVHGHSSRHWADVLRSTMPDDILDLLEEVESMSYDSRLPSPP